MSDKEHILFLLRCNMQRATQTAAKVLAKDILAWAKDFPLSKEDKKFFENGAQSNSGLEVKNERIEKIDGVEWVCYECPYRGNKNPARYVKQLHDIVKDKNEELLKFFGTRIGFQQGKCVIDLSGKSAFYP